MHLLLLLAAVAMADTANPEKQPGLAVSTDGSLVYSSLMESKAFSFSVRGGIEGTVPAGQRLYSGTVPVFQNQYSRPDGAKAMVEVFRAAPASGAPESCTVDVIIISARNLGAAAVLVTPMVTVSGNANGRRIHSPFPFTENGTKAGKLLKFQGKMLPPGGEYSVTLSVTTNSSLLLPTCLDGALDLRRKTIAWWEARDQKQSALPNPRF